LNDSTQIEIFKGVAFIQETDLFRDVLQKFVFAKGQAIFLDRSSKVAGLITINDIMNFLL
jgi:Mg2+/Co2+ transporter CorC